ncbi:MAG: cell division protein ZapA [Ruminococcus sp.]|nr:cell division protein ZapA [Ruminococcus sp.]
MNKHTVYVAGKHFVLLSDDKSEYVQNLAEEVNETISKLSVENPSLDRRGAAILCALDYADDMHKAESKNKSLSEKAQPLISQADKQSRQLKELKETLAEKDNEIVKLKKELDDLRTAFEKSTHVLDGSGMVKNNPSPKPDNYNNHNNHQKKKTNKGYRPMRQYTLFDDEK